MKFANFYLFLTVIGIFTWEIQGQVNYCNSRLCPAGVVHIGCDNTEKFAPSCMATSRIIPLTSSIVTTILEGHNRVRNNTASGLYYTHIPPAARMATMQWDCDLAALAHLSVVRCTREPDACRSTTTFPYAEQQTVVTSFKQCTTVVPNVENVIQRQINFWAAGIHGISWEIINSYARSNAASEGYNFFANLVLEENTHVGCALLRQEKLGYVQQLMVCNYAYRNFATAPVYGQAPIGASHCYRRSPTYPYLCDISEKYNLRSINYVK